MPPLALFGGAPLRSLPFPQCNTIGAEEKRAVMAVLDSGVLSKFLGVWHSDFYGGPRVREAERLYAERFQARYAVTVNSATTALQVALAATGIEPGDEVIVSPYTMSASASVILMQQAIPVFADVEPDYFCLDPVSIRRCITPQTRAILVPHIFGLPADMAEILTIAREHHLRVIEDAAQSIGATWRGRFAGVLGDAGVLSLNYHKIIHSGEGGILLTQNEPIAKRAQLARNHGEVVVDDWPDWPEISNTLGSNFRMTEIEAAIAAAQLAKLDFLLEHRRRLAARLTQRLSGVPALQPPAIRPDCTHSWYVYALRFFPEIAGVPRELFCQALAAEGIPCGQGYVKPLYLQRLYQQRIAYGKSGAPWTSNHYRGQVSYERGICPVTENLHFSELIAGDYCAYPLTERDVDDIADGFLKVVEALPQLRGRALHAVGS